ncbi:MAG: hypothetical protein WDO74_36225 [Pseudomonadota bacterium]
MQCIGGIGAVRRGILDLCRLLQYFGHQPGRLRQLGVFAQYVLGPLERAERPALLE